MNTIKVRIIAYVAFGIINLVGFVYLIGETRYSGLDRIATISGSPLCSAGSLFLVFRATLSFPLQPAGFPLPSLLFYGEESLD
jgi:hypothetical protein